MKKASEYLADGVAGDVDDHPVDELLREQARDAVVDQHDGVQGGLVRQGPAHLGPRCEEAWVITQAKLCLIGVRICDKLTRINCLIWPDCHPEWVLNPRLIFRYFPVIIRDTFQQILLLNGLGTMSCLDSWSPAHNSSHNDGDGGSGTL